MESNNEDLVKLFSKVRRNILSYKIYKEWQEEWNSLTKILFTYSDESEATFFQNLLIENHNNGELLLPVRDLTIVISSEKYFSMKHL